LQGTSDPGGFPGEVGRLGLVLERAAAAASVEGADRVDTVRACGQDGVDGGPGAWSGEVGEDLLAGECGLDVDQAAGLWIVGGAVRVLAEALDRKAGENRVSPRATERRLR
jgi:hypothetical protein